MYVLDQGCMDGLPTSRGYYSNQQPSSYPTLGARVVNSPGATLNPLSRFPLNPSKSDQDSCGPDDGDELRCLVKGTQ